MKKSAVWEWADGRNMFLVMFAQNAAMTAQECYEACLLASKKKNVDGSTHIPLKDWARFYAHPGRAQAKSYDIILGEAGRSEMRKFVEEVNTWEKTTKAERKKAIAGMNPATVQRVMKEALQKLLRILSEHGEELEKDIRWERDGLGEPPPDYLERLQTPEVLFFLRVLFPCWLLYGESLYSLMRRVRKGDEEALDKILRLDSGAMNVPSILRQVTAAMQNPSRRKKIGDAIKGRPRRKITLQKVKVVIAALILKLSVKMEAEAQKAERILKRRRKEFVYPKTRLESPDIRALFDAVAKDTRGELQDNDLPPGDHAFYMAIKRELPFWSGWF